MDDRRWYGADALMADLGIHRHEMPGASEEKIAQRMREHYPDAVAILVRERTGTKAQFGSYIKRAPGEAKARGESTGMRERTSEPEFYANATLGFRQWTFSLEAAGCSRLEHLKLQPGSFYELHGEVPGIGCSCGFYAHGRRDSSGSETSVHVVGGVVAGWSNLELHEGGFKCTVAKVLALFEPDPRKEHADYNGVAHKKWAALERMCADNDIPLLSPDALREDEEVRRYAYERDLVLLEDQLILRETPWPTLEAIEGEEGLAS